MAVSRDKVGAGKSTAMYLRAPDRTENDRTSVEAQRAACQALADELGYTITTSAIFEDGGTSASSARPGLAALFRAIGDQHIQALITYQLDRLARGGGTLQEALLKELRRREVRLYLANIPRGYHYDTTTGKLYQDDAEIAAANKAPARPVEYVVIPVEGE